MASKRKPTAPRPKRKLPRGYGVRDAGAEPVVDLDSLKRQTTEACEAEFAQRFGEPFLARRGPGLWFAKMWQAELDRRATEDSARQLYSEARKAAARGTLPSQQPKILRFVTETPAGAGGAAAMALTALAQALAQGITPQELRPISYFEEEYARLHLKGLARDDGFAALVRSIVREAPRPPVQRTVSNRDVAVIAVLCEAAPDWEAYEAKLEDDERATALTPAVVIEEVETRVRKIVQATAAEAIRPG